MISHLSFALSKLSDGIYGNAVGTERVLKRCNCIYDSELTIFTKFSSSKDITFEEYCEDME